jgi:hypothetical protein
VDSNERNVDHEDDGLDPADRPEPSMTAAADKAGVPVDRRAANAGGEMSETIRSRDPDLDDEDGA